MTDTIFALSSGRPPAAIAIVRISGPAARRAAAAMCGALPAPRRAALRTLRAADGTPLDRALTLVFDGPATATGEDLVELHLHGGRAVVRAVEQALGALPDVRPALPGEFTRRALENGRIDLSQAQGLADLLEAETEAQRRAAFSASDGAIRRLIQRWLDSISDMSAQIEAELDFADEAEVAHARPLDVAAALAPLIAQIDHVLAQPTVERLGDGICVALAGPRNAGKSSLFNALLQREAAIVTPIPGTTRDLIEAQVARAGIPYRLIDTAGLIDHTDDVVERIGIERARVALQQADLILWLGKPADAPQNALRISAKADLHPQAGGSDIAVSVHDAASIARLWDRIATATRSVMACDGGIALRAVQRDSVAAARAELAATRTLRDPLLQAEHLRIAARGLGAVIGRDATEAMLDALFGRFCLGK